MSQKSGGNLQKLKVHDQQKGDSWKEWVHCERALGKEIWYMVHKVIWLQALLDSSHASRSLSLLEAVIFNPNESRDRPLRPGLWIDRVIIGDRAVEDRG